MKKLFTKFLGLALSVMVLASCSQMATYEQEDLTLDEVAAAKNGFNLTPYGTGGNENAYTVDAYFTYSSETSTICYDEEGSFTVSFFAQNTLIECGNFIMQYALIVEGVDPVWENLDETTPNDGVVSATLTGLPIGEYTFRGQWLRTGSVESCPKTYVNTGWRVSTDNLIVEACPECDDAAFSYDTEDNQNIVFTYNHGEEVESLTLAFTFPQILNLPLNVDDNYVGSDGKIYTVNNPTNQTVFTWTGEVSCKVIEAETFAFSVVADCSAPPANDGQALIWTDAKIIAVDGAALVDDILTAENEGPYSLKGALPSIVYLGCPVNP